MRGKQRPACVTFPRWIALCVQHIGTGYVGEPEDALAFATMSSRLINVVPQDGDPHLTNNMLAWITDPYFQNPCLVNFVPPVADPIGQHPNADDQNPDQGHASPQQRSANASSSSSSSDAHHSQRSPASQQTADHTVSVHIEDAHSGDTVTLHLSEPSEADTKFSGPSSSSPLITRSSPQPINQQLPRSLS